MKEVGGAVGANPDWSCFNDEPISASATRVVYHAPPTVCSESIRGQKVTPLFALVLSAVGDPGGGRAGGQVGIDQAALHASK